MARHGRAGQGGAWHGAARLGLARQGHPLDGDRLTEEKEMESTRLVVLSDTHCGSVFGLTPDGVFDIGESDELLVARTAGERKKCWQWFSKAIDSLKPIDRLVLNGDMVEGDANRQAGLELLTTDPLEQIKIAQRVVEFVGCKQVAITAGTAYHTGTNTDYERLLADATGGKLGGHDYYNVNGLVLSIKHHVGGSQTPVGRATALTREAVWNVLWADRGEFPRANVLIRSHVHYHTAFSGYPINTLSMTTPCLQTPGSRFGARRCSGVVDYGFVVFDINKDGTYSWSPLVWSGADTAWAQVPINWS